MKFGFVPLGDAKGAILAHALEACLRPYDRQMSYVISKGTCLTQDYLADLEEEGHETVLVAQLECGDVGENEAALHVGRSLIHPDGMLKVTPAKTGRVNVIAEGPGILDIDQAAIHAANAIDPMVTIATAKPYARTHDGFMAATVKIISYAVSQKVIDQAVMSVRGAMRVQPPIYTSSLLIETGFSQQMHEKKSKKGLNALNGRLQALSMCAAEHKYVAHDIDMLAAALKAADAEVIFILTASATSDRRDIGPTALQVAGGEMIHFGMPVDPGNLLFYGELNGKSVIGLPGCARSPALNGADWVMQRLLCGVDVRPSDIAAMGVGGLLKEVPERPHPREISLK